MNAQTQTRKPTGAILIVDADPDIRFIVGYAMKNAGWQIHRAPTGQIALEVLTHHPCDVVLLDLYLPDMDGLTLLAQLKAAQPEVMTIVVTSAVAPPVKKIVRRDAFAYLKKPCPLNKIVRYAQHALEQKMQDE